jgi:phytoene dehydrogenase-like protein
VGGSLEFARSIEKRYRELGGVIHYRQKVEKILTEDGRAVGVKLADGSEHRADIVISDADGRRTILNLLEGKYLDERIRGYCAEPPDETNWAVHVFLGVDRDLSAEPSALVMLLDKPVTIAGHTADSLEMQMYGHDKTLAPAGKGVIKVELVSKYSYWKQLYADRPRYDAEKQKVAEQVIDLLETRFPGIRGQVEVTDVPTLMTWERYMGGSHGFLGMPSKKVNIMASVFGKGWETTLPGLSRFYMVGQWATSAGALFSNALSGRTVIKAICKQEGRQFVTQ